MAVTQEEIRNRAAKKLALFGVGQTLRDDFAADLDNAYDEVYAELQRRYTLPWGSSADIPDQFAWGITALVAEARVMEYKPPPERMAQIQVDAQRAWLRIAAAASRPYIGTAEIQNY